MDDERRRFCKAAGLVVVSSALPVVGSVGCGGGAEMFFNGGPASAVAMNEAVQVPIPDHITWVCRDAGGLYAMSAYCTHAHCVLQFNDLSTGMPLGFQCNCHDSTFDYNGQNNTPPAPGPLEHFKLVVDDTGAMFIDPSTSVDPSDRTKG
jgi:Rieske Fe-S protein